MSGPADLLLPAADPDIPRLPRRDGAQQTGPGEQSETGGTQDQASHLDSVLNN